MKKIFFSLLLLVALALPARAQFSAYGVQLGGGYSHVVDNLISKGGIFGFGVGGYVTYEFSEAKSVLADRFYLQGGLNIIRRGGQFEQSFNVVNGTVTYTTTRQGYYHAWYAQIPILASFRYELPINKAGHYVRAFVGPALSVGLFGNYSDRCVSPHRPQTSVNFNIEKDPAFDHMNRIDVDAIIGVGYQYDNIVANLYVDYGFLAIGKETDVLRTLENVQQGSTEEVFIPGGNIATFMLSVAYQFPIKH